VRFIEIFHEAWDQHGNLVADLKKNCRDTDKASAALIKDLKQRGMLDDTLVVWGGEFGRTPMVQGGDDGRDHHPNCFTMWLAGGGIKRGITLGESDEFGFNATADKVHVHDLHATIAAFVGFRSHQVDVPFSGQGFPAYRCAWRTCAKAAGMKISAALWLSFLVPSSVLVAADNSPTDDDAAYTRAITRRADKIVAALGIADTNKSVRVRDIITRQYRDLRQIPIVRSRRRRNMPALTCPSSAVPSGRYWRQSNPSSTSFTRISSPDSRPSFHRSRWTR
jgi:hypothetical protein